jgi:hypothetical protein
LADIGLASRFRDASLTKVNCTASAVQFFYGIPDEQRADIEEPDVGGLIAFL